MADCTKSAKKQNDADSSTQIPTRLHAAQGFVNLRETSQFCKSLVNWCKDHQEVSETPKAPAARLCAEFSSCGNIKAHRKLSNFLPNRRRHKNKDKRKIKGITKRNNGLCCFIEGTEQFERNIEEPSQDNKQKAQSQNSNASISTATSKLFTNHRKGIVFNFKHFTDPEEIVSEYINVHIYNRTRLGKVDKKKVSASVIALHNVQKDACAEFNDSGADKSTIAVRVSGTFLHSDKSSTNILKLEKRLPRIKFAERATATKNFIFELEALDATNMQNGRNYQTPSFGDLSDAKLMSEKKGRPLQRTRKSVLLLPKLNLTELQAIDLENEEANNFVAGKTVLPDIPRRKNSSCKNSSCKKKGMRHSAVDRRKPDSDIDVQVADVKSNWQILKQKRNWTQGNDGRSGQYAKSKSLYDTIERMSAEICKTQVSYLDQSVDDRRRFKKVPGMSLGKESGKIRDSLFPEGKSSEMNTKTSSVKYLYKRTEGEKEFGKNLMRLSDKSSSKTLPPKGMCDVKTGSELGVENDFLRKKTLSQFKRREITASKSEVEKYLDEYSLTLDKEISDSRRKKTASYPSSEVVADMLTKLNIYDVGFYIDAKKKEESIAFTNPGKHRDSAMKFLDRGISANQNQNPSIEGLSRSYKFDNVTKPREIESQLIKKERKKSSAVEQNSARNQTDKTVIGKNSNAFVRMGLNSLEEKIPKHLRSQILKSDFLKKDLSFKPAKFFRNSLNFKNTLNSRSKLTFGLGKAGTDSSPCEKWLQQKIQRIIANNISDGLKNEKNSQKIVKKLQFEYNYKKLREIVDERLRKKKSEKNFTDTTKQSFAQKFLKVHNEILKNSRLRAILPGLVDGIQKFSKIQTR